MGMTKDSFIAQDRNEELMGEQVERTFFGEASVTLHNFKNIAVK